MSEEGGLEDVEESLRAEARWAWTWARAASSRATVAVSASTCACKRAQWAQGVVASAPMPAHCMPIPARGTRRACLKRLHDHGHRLGPCGRLLDSGLFHVFDDQDRRRYI